MWNWFINLEISTNGHVITVICIHLAFKIRGMSTNIKLWVAHTPLYRLLCKWWLKLQRDCQFFFSLTALRRGYPKIFMDFGFNIKSNTKTIKIFICPLLNVYNRARQRTCYNYTKSAGSSLWTSVAHALSLSKQSHSLWIQPKWICRRVRHLQQDGTFTPGSSERMEKGKIPRVSSKPWFLLFSTGLVETDRRIISLRSHSGMKRQIFKFTFIDC